MNENEPKEIEVVTGDGSELNISEVEKHLEIQKPKPKDKKEIVIPGKKWPIGDGSFRDIFVLFVPLLLIVYIKQS